MGYNIERVKVIRYDGHFRCDKCTRTNFAGGQRTKHEAVEIACACGWKVGNDGTCLCPDCHKAENNTEKSCDKEL